MRKLRSRGVQALVQPLAQPGDWLVAHGECSGSISTHQLPADPPSGRWPSGGGCWSHRPGGSAGRCGAGPGPHQGVLLLLSLVPLGLRTRRCPAWCRMGRDGKPACSALTQPRSACALPAAFPCERCLIISDRVQRRHLFTSGESPFRLSITVTCSTFLEALFPFIMGPGGEGGEDQRRHEAQRHSWGHHSSSRSGSGRPF